MDQSLDAALKESLGHLGQVFDTGSRQIVNAVNDLRQPAVPLPRIAVGTANSSGDALLTFDAVSQGERWDLYRLVVGGVTWATTAAGSAVVYRTTSTATTSPSLTAVIDNAATLPNIAFYLDNQAPLQSGEKLVVYVSGGTSGQQYIASAQFNIVRS